MAAVSMRQFIRMVDAIISNKVGCSVHDLPDFDFSSYYDDEFTVDEAKDAAEDCAADMLYDLKMG